MDMYRDSGKCLIIVDRFLIPAGSLGSTLLMIQPCIDRLIYHPAINAPHPPKLGAVERSSPRIRDVITDMSSSDVISLIWIDTQ